MSSRRQVFTNGRTNTKDTLPGVSQKRQLLRNQALTSRLPALFTTSRRSFLTVSRTFGFCLPFARILPPTAPELSCRARVSCLLISTLGQAIFQGLQGAVDIASLFIRHRDAHVPEADVLGCNLLVDATSKHNIPLG